MSDRSTPSDLARRRYNRIAPVYDVMETLAEGRYGPWRRLAWSKVEGTRILEVGVGTGKNFAYYPPDKDIIAIDLSEQMLSRAAKRANTQGVHVQLKQMDVMDLEFADDSFDAVIATFVFCSVPDPVRGLAEVARVLKPGGKLVLLEHVLSANRILALFMNALNPLVVRVMGANINRRTVGNVEKAGLQVEIVTELGAGIFKLIEARA